MRMLRAATLTTPDLDATVARYRKYFGYTVAEEGQVTPALSASWGTPGASGHRYALMLPQSAEQVFLRFIQTEEQPPFHPLRTYGWAAIELCVRDTLEVCARLEHSPFRIIGPPRELDGLPAIFPMQVQGPDGDVVFLTQIRGDLPEYDLPRARSPVDRLFIAVLACSDIDRSMRWFSDTLGVELGGRFELEYAVLSAAFSLPESHRHLIAVGAHRRDCFLEFDQYPPQATSRAGRPGDLEPGIALVSVAHPRLENIPRGSWILPPQRGPGLLYGGREAGTLRAPDGTLVEVIGAA